MSAAEEPSTEAGTPAARPPRSRSIVLGAVGGAVAALLALLIVAVLLLRNPTPPLTHAAFDAALARWEAQGPASYDLDVVISGRQPGSVHVEVRDGTVTRMTRDGRSPSQRRTWDYWSVPSLFEMIRTDMESAAGAGHPGGDGQQLSLRAVFDPQWGYPQVYQRHALGIQQTAEWRVIRFDVKSEDGSPTSRISRNSPQS